MLLLPVYNWFCLVLQDATAEEEGEFDEEGEEEEA